MRKKGILYGVLFFVISVFAGCMLKNPEVEPMPEYVLRMAEVHPKDYPTTQADFEFARRVEVLSEGRIKIVVCPNQVLGSESDVIEQMLFGGIDLARVSLAPISEEANILKVLYLPYLYEDVDHMRRVLRGEIGDEIFKEIETDGFIGFGWFEAGARSFYNTQKPIKKLEDLEGMRIRVHESQLMLDMANELGVSGVKMPYGEVYRALQLGDIDGAENNPPSYYTSEHYKIAKYYSIDEHVRVPEIIVGSKVALKNMPQEALDIIRQAAKEMQEYQQKLWEEGEAKALMLLKEEGVEINRIEDKTVFVQAVQPIYDKHKERYGELIERIHQERKKKD